MSHNFKEKLGLNFETGIRSHPLPSAPKGKSINYYYKTKRELGYVSDYPASALVSDDSIHHNHSISTPSWDSNYSIGDHFKGLTVNMASVSHLEDDKYEGILQSEEDPWIKHLNALWDTHFGQCEPPIDINFSVSIMGLKNIPRLSLSAKACHPWRKRIWSSSSANTSTCLLGTMKTCQVLTPRWQCIGWTSTPR